MRSSAGGSPARTRPLRRARLPAQDLDCSLDRVTHHPGLKCYPSSRPLHPTDEPRGRGNERRRARRAGERSPAPRRRHELASRPRRRGSRRPPASSTARPETAGAERATPARRAGGRPPGRDPNAHRRRATQRRRVRTAGRSAACERARRSSWRENTDPPARSEPPPPQVGLQRRVLSAPHRGAATAGQRAEPYAARGRAEPSPTPAPRAGEPARDDARAERAPPARRSTRRGRSADRGASSSWRKNARPDVS